MGLYLTACRVLRGPDDLRRLVTEIAEDAAADGAVWVEVHFDTNIGEDTEATLFLELSAEVTSQTGVGVGLVMAADKTLDPAVAVGQVACAAPFAQQGVVAFGLVNDETDHPPEPFREAFAIARDAGLISAPHAGELVGPSSVRGALDALGAKRIGHGVRAVEDRELLRRLADEGVCLDVCPSSNLAMGLYDSVVERPVGELLAAGSK
jgi:adenosine deaminase